MEISGIKKIYSNCDKSLVLPDILTIDRPNLCSDLILFLRSKSILRISQEILVPLFLGWLYCHGIV